MITPISVVSVLPDTHVVSNFKDERSVLRFRIDHKSKEYVSISDDDSHFEWRVSKCLDDLVKSAGIIADWMDTQHFNVSVFITVPDQSSVLGKPQISLIETIFGPCIARQPAGEVCASAWMINGNQLRDLLAGEVESKAVSSDSGEMVPETDSVRIKTALDFQRLMRRLENSVDPKSVLFIRFVIFSDNRILHFVLAKDTEAAKILSFIPQARMSRKSGSPFVHLLKTTTERCLSPLLAGNAKPFLLIDATTITEASVTTYQSLFDIGEKMCITALPCESELNLRMEDFEIIDSIDKLPCLERKLSVPPRVSVHLDDTRRKSVGKAKSVGVKKKDSSITDSTDEIDELKAENLSLKCEIDRLNASRSTDTGNHAYTNHLVSEVKQLRSELLQVETDKRKYDTSKRLVDSLIEKSNRLKTESASRASKIDELRRQETLLRSELAQMKESCEYLLRENKELSVKLEEQQECSRRPETPTTVESFYHEFLFPFNRKRDLAKTIVGIHETLQRIERSVAINAPSSVMDVRKCLSNIEKVKDMTNDLISASEKLEISSATLIKKISRNVV